jgi:hypothetical protein
MTWQNRWYQHSYACLILDCAVQGFLISASLNWAQKKINSSSISFCYSENCLYEKNIPFMSNYVITVMFHSIQVLDGMIHYCTWSGNIQSLSPCYNNVYSIFLLKGMKENVPFQYEYGHLPLFISGHGEY